MLVFIWTCEEISRTKLYYIIIICQHVWDQEYLFYGIKNRLLVRQTKWGNSNFVKQNPYLFDSFPPTHSLFLLTSGTPTWGPTVTTVVLTMRWILLVFLSALSLSSSSATSPGSSSTVLSSSWARASPAAPSSSPPPGSCAWPGRWSELPSLRTNWLRLQLHAFPPDC